MITVYIDGACANNGKKNAISGYGIYFSENDPRNESKQVDGDKHTNNIAELTAFIRCLEILDENKKEAENNSALEALKYYNVNVNEYSSNI